MAPRILNLPEWRGHLLSRLRRQVDVSGDAVLGELLVELQGYGPPVGRTEHTEVGGVVVPLRLQSPVGVLSFITTTTVFGTPIDITLSELALETFFPADESTAEALRALAVASLQEQTSVP